uniref:Vacuolar protein sorting-associated protein 54 n=1 Tax=Sinocyclocheilus rhinocerous TaxID=307959 RepID=A0A673GGY4_9TELE
MSSNQGSSPVAQSSCPSDGLFRKPRASSMAPRHYRPPPPRSLPDVCPKEPTGEGRALCDGPSVVADQHRWTVYNSKVNLPAALNDPRLAKRESDFFTKTWGLAFTETEVMPSFYLPNISREHFSSYLQETAQREKIHERCKNICPSKDDLSVPTITNNHDKARAELEQVPKIFMKPEFVLNDPATFNAVLPWSHFSVAGGNNSRDVASSRLLQEKLSHYLDVVEVSIARQISLRSEAFFHAMSSQHELQDRLRETADAVAKLRACTAAIDRVMCRGPLRALRDALTCNNCIKLHNKLKLMAAVHQTQPTVQLLLSTSEFVGALELIATTKEVLQQELQGIHSFRCSNTRSPQSDLSRPFEEDSQVLEKVRRLSRVTNTLTRKHARRIGMCNACRSFPVICVRRHLGSQLCEMERLIDKMMVADFSMYAQSDLSRPFEEDSQVLEKATLGIIRNVVLEVLDSSQRSRLAYVSSATNPSDGRTNEDEEEEESGGPALHPGEAELAYLTHEGLFISDALNEAEQRSNVAAHAQTRAQTRTDACGSDSASATTESSSSREHNSNTTSSLPIGCAAAISEDVMPSDQELGRVANNVQELLHTASDVSQDRCVKVLMTRAKDGSLERLSSSEFVCLSQAVESFVSDTEELCGRRSVSLRGALQSQAYRFVQRFHEERKTKLSLLLDNERWKQAEVPAEFQDLVDSIADGRITLPERKPTGSEDRKPSEFLCVDGQKYAVVGTVLLLIRMFLEYCQCVNDIPSITTDILTRLAELLKHFNSRSCQLVLGAGALQVVGLKTITTRNLALASRCLQLLVHYIPVIRAHFETRLQPKQYSILRHFGHITKDYNDHIAEISAKLVAIMDSMFEKALFKYEVKAPMPSACLRNVCKQMAKMHEAINELLPEEQTQMLFLRINASFKLHLKRQLARLGVINDGGPQLVMVDVAFYSENVQALRSLECLDLNMPEIWEQKR